MIFLAMALAHISGEPNPVCACAMLALFSSVPDSIETSLSTSISNALDLSNLVSFATYDTLLETCRCRHLLASTSSDEIFNHGPYGIMERYRVVRNRPFLWKLIFCSHSNIPLVESSSW